MTDENKQALEEMKREVRHNNAMEYNETGAKSYQHGFDVGYNKALDDVAALQPKPSVDVEALKRKESDATPTEKWIEKGWNECIDHLHEQGHLIQGWRDIQPNMEEINDYINSYTFECDEGTYMPSEDERFLLMDAIYGLIDNMQDFINQPPKDDA